MGLKNLTSDQVQTKGNQSTVKVSDTSQIEILMDILLELKKINLHLGVMSELDLETLNDIQDIE